MSLKAHSVIFEQSCRSESPSALRQEKVLNILEDVLSPIRQQVPEDFDTYQSFLRAVRKLDNSSTPGYPHCTEYPTIGEYLGFNGISYDDFKLQRLWFQVQQILDGEPELLFNVFIKEEPHKISKIEEGRLRLIVGSPLHFQVFCHMLFDFQNDKIIEKAYDIPCQQGLILNSGGWRRYYDQWTSLGLNAGLDMRAWDWTVPLWKILLVMRLRTRLVYGARSERWVHQVEKAYRMLFECPALILSNGEVWRQLFGGIMKSGCVNTISDNSFAQLIDHILVCQDVGVDYLPLPRVVGDDKLQQIEQFISCEAYARYGGQVKSVTEGLEFVGLEFSSEGPQPLYYEKHVYKVAYSKSVLVDYLDAMLRYYVYSPRFYFWQNLAFKLGIGDDMRSRAYYLSWYEYGLD